MFYLIDGTSDIGFEIALFMAQNGDIKVFL